MTRTLWRRASSTVMGRLRFLRRSRKAVSASASMGSFESRDSVSKAYTTSLSIENVFRFVVLAMIPSYPARLEERRRGDFLTAALGFRPLLLAVVFWAPFFFGASPTLLRKA